MHDPSTVAFDIKNIQAWSEISVLSEGISRDLHHHLARRPDGFTGKCRGRSDDMWLAYAAHEDR